MALKFDIEPKGNCPVCNCNNLDIDWDEGGYYLECLGCSYQFLYCEQGGCRNFVDLDKKLCSHHRE